MAYETKLIDHLSKEIQTHTNNLMTFRARINLAIFIGPFLLLGSILFRTQGVPRGISSDVFTIAACIGLAMSYFIMGMACYRIEAHTWEQCNKWRALIARLTKESYKSDDNPEINEKNLEFIERLKYGYSVVYGAMIVAFICALQIITHLKVAGTP